MFGMSWTRKDLLTAAQKYASTLIEHLLKIFLYPNHKEFTKGWAEEVYAAFHEVSKMKRTNDYPDPNEISSSLFRYSDAEFQIVIESVVRSNTEVESFNVSASELKSAVLSVINKEALILSNQGSISISQVFKCINDTLEEFYFTDAYKIGD